MAAQYGLNRDLKKWEGRCSWIKDMKFWLIIALALGGGVGNIPNTGAIMVVIIACTFSLFSLCLAFVRWRKIKTLRRRIRLL